MASCGAGHHAAAGFVDSGEVDVGGHVDGDVSGLDATATMAPAGAACIRRARIDTTLIAAARSKTPARVAATSSPMLCPASAAG